MRGASFGFYRLIAVILHVIICQWELKQLFHLNCWAIFQLTTFSHLFTGASSYNSGCPAPLLCPENSLAHKIILGAVSLLKMLVSYWEPEGLPKHSAGARKKGANTLNFHYLYIYIYMVDRNSKSHNGPNGIF